MSDGMTVREVVDLALKLGADDAAVQLTSGSTTQVKFANSSIAIVQNWSSSLLSIFVAHKKRTAFITVEDLDHSVVRGAVERLLKIAKNSQPNKDWAGLAEGPFKYIKPNGTFDKAVIDKADSAVEWVNAAIAASKAPKTAGVLYVNDQGSALATSGGVDAQDRGTSIELSIRAFFGKEESGHAVATSRTVSGFRPETAGEKAGEIAREAKRPKLGEAGKFDVIFDPLAFSDLLCVAASEASAYSVDAGFSFFADKIGKKVASPAVTLVDDPSIAGGFGSAVFDEEGRPVQRVPVIEGGILKTYLHNTSTAKKFGAKPTASAGIISPHPRNVILEPGRTSREELFSQVKSGLYVTNIWYTRFQNYRTGDFSTIPRDGIFIIRNGKLWQPIKGIRITDNMQRILENVVSVSNRPETILWWGMEYQVPVTTPYVLVKGVNITQPTM